MTDGPINFNEEKMQRSRDCRDWKPIDALKACIRDIESGEYNPDMLFIGMREKKDGYR